MQINEVFIKEEPIYKLNFQLFNNKIFTKSSSLVSKMLLPIV